MKHTIFTILCLFASVVVTSAEDMAAIKKQMAERLPAIVEMKSAQLVGENNKAYLSTLGTVSEHQAGIVQKENSDRKVIYTLLAKKTGASLDLILAKRAEQIRGQAAPGTKVQMPDGSWVVK